MYVCFIDYAKAFDRVKQKINMIYGLKEIGLDGKDIRIIANLYWHQQAAIRVENDLSEYTPIQRGVRQGCVLSPILFNLYTELIFRQFEDSKGTNIGGYDISNLRYVDDTVLVSDTEEGLQRLVTEASIESGKAGLGMNVKKTKTMVISKFPETAKTDILLVVATVNCSYSEICCACPDEPSCLQITFCCLCR